MALGEEAQLGGQAFAVGEQALDRRRVEAAVPGGELVDPVIDELGERRPGAVVRSSVLKMFQ